MLDVALNFRESKIMKKTMVGLLFAGSLLCPKKVKSVHRRACPSFEGMGDFFTIGSPISLEKVKPLLMGQSFRYFYEHERNQVCSAIFS